MLAIDLVGGFKHDWIIFHFIYGRCHPSHWLSLHHFSRWLLHHQPDMFIIYKLTMERSTMFHGKTHYFYIPILPQMGNCDAMPRTAWLAWHGITGSKIGSHDFTTFHIWLWINTYENTILMGWTWMNIHKSQLFWCELQGYKVLTHCHIFHGKRTEIYSSEFPLNHPGWIYSWFLGSLIGEYDKHYRMYHGGWVSNHHPSLRSIWI